MATCARSDCQATATATPVLILHPFALELMRADLDPEPATMHLELPVCPEHQAVTSVDDLVTDDGWTDILQAFRSVGRVDPDRASLKLRWQPIA